MTGRYHLWSTRSPLAEPVTRLVMSLKFIVVWPSTAYG